MFRLSRVIVISVCVVLAPWPVTPAQAAADGAPVEDILRATFRITHGSSSGTGFIVVVDPRNETDPRRHVLVTAAHVFEELKGDECTLVLRARAGDRRFVRKDVPLRVRDGKKTLWTRHPQMDAAAIPVELPETVDVKPFRLAQIADAAWAEARKVRVGSDVVIPCYPAQLSANPAGWPILRKGSIATHPLTPLAEAKTIFVDYSHFGGDSGSPVVQCDGADPVVVGLVFAMVRQTDSSHTAFEDRTTHTSLGLAVVVQSPFVRETIELLLKHERDRVRAR